MMKTFQIIEDFATRQDLSTATVVSSVAQSYAEWYIPGRSFDPVSVPKKMLDGLFEMIPKENIDKIT